MSGLDQMKRRLTWTVYATPLMTFTTDLGLSIRVSMFGFVRLVTGSSSGSVQCPGSHQVFPGLFPTFLRNQTRTRKFCFPWNRTRIPDAVLGSVNPLQPFSGLKTGEKPVQVSSVRSVGFNRPVGWSRSISTVGSVPPTGQHGRYRRSVRLHLRRIAVDIDGRFGSFYPEIGRYRPYRSVHTKKKSGDGRYRPSKWTNTQKTSGKVLISSLRTHTSQCQLMKTTVCHTRFWLPWTTSSTFH